MSEEVPEQPVEAPNPNQVPKQQPESGCTKELYAFSTLVHLIVCVAI
jgi:hypothetical protein